ncbi:MAG TPA: SRPBCC family protein [Nocardioides sp.]|nr:SRPBCC family protein [Nocardioides sp.]
MNIEQRATSTATPDQVWAVLSDLDAWPEVLSTVDRVEREGPAAPHGVGTAYYVEQPKVRRARWEVTEWKPGRSFTWTSSAPGLSMTATHEVAPTPSGGTEIVLGMHWSGPLAGLLGLVYGRLVRRYMKTEATAVAARAEE